MKPTLRLESKLDRPRLFAVGRACGNSDLSFFLSCFCFLSRNNGRKTNATPRARAQAPHTEWGVRPQWMAAAACECASRVADSHGADAQGGRSMEAGADDNAPYDFRKFFNKKPVISDVIIRPFRFLFAAPGHRRKPSATENKHQHCMLRARGNQAADSIRELKSQEPKHCHRFAFHQYWLESPLSGGLFSRASQYRMTSSCSNAFHLSFRVD